MEKEDPLNTEGDIEFVSVPSLNPDILTALGNELPTKANIGEDIHKDLAFRWDSILKKGLDEHTKTELIKKYPTPKNCQAINPPQVNPEVKAAVTEATLGRDERLNRSQTQLGSALSALGKTLTHLLQQSEKEGEGNEGLIGQIEAVSDAARLLADLHHSSSQSRQKLLGVKLDKSLQDIVNDTALDGWLFGDNLSEKIRAAKAIEKSGAALRPTVTKTFPRKPLNGKQPLKRTPRLSGYNQRQGHQYRQNYQQSDRHYKRRPAHKTRYQHASTEVFNKDKRPKLR